MAVTKSSTKDTKAANAEVKEREAELAKPADVPPVENAEGFEASGAPKQAGNFDPDHPAIDNNPRAETTVGQNKIDMNDPNLSMEEAVEKNLKEGGSGVVVAGSDAAKAEEKKD